MSTAPPPNEEVSVAPYPTAWRSRAVLVAKPEAPLPDRCLRCGRAAAGFRARRRFWWHPRWVFLLAVHPVFYIIAAALTRHTAAFRVPLCPRHRRMRTAGRVVGWLAIVPMAVLSAAGLALDALPAALLGLYGTLAASVFARVATHVAGVQRIDEHFARLRGVDAAVLDSLPDWDAFQEPA